MFLDSAFQTSAAFSHIHRTAFFTGTGPSVHCILAQMCYDFVLGMHE